MLHHFPNAKPFGKVDPHVFYHVFRYTFLSGPNLALDCPKKEFDAGLDLESEVAV